MDTNAFRLDGKVAWITGGSYGIGFAIASAYAQMGAKIVFNDLNEEKMKMGIEAYKKIGIDARGFVCDVTKEDQVVALVDEVIKEFGHLDILVNNAGIIKRIPMTEMKAEEYRQVIDVDLVAPFICSKAVIPHMIKNGHGTPQTAPLREKQPDGSMHPFDAFIRAKTPANRWGEPEDLQGPAVFLASDASNFVNGHVLYVDGGILAYIGKQPQ